MNKNDVNNILEFLTLNYPDFKVTDELFNYWLDELQQYDYDDVLNKIKELMSTGKFNNRPPVLVNVINGLNKKSNKIDWKKSVVYCKTCGKAFNCKEDFSSPDLKEHEERCSSINYVIKQTKKWFNKNITRAELWSLSKEDFDERYDKLLHYIYEHTENQDEKDVIGYIWNPPNPQIAKNFLNKVGMSNDEEIYN